MNFDQIHDVIHRYFDASKTCPLITIYVIYYRKYVAVNEFEHCFSNNVMYIGVKLHEVKMRKTNSPILFVLSVSPSIH